MSQTVELLAGTCPGHQFGRDIKRLFRDRRFVVVRRDCCRRPTPVVQTSPFFMVLDRELATAQQSVWCASFKLTEAAAEATKPLAGAQVDIFHSINVVPAQLCHIAPTHKHTHCLTFMSSELPDSSSSTTGHVTMIAHRPNKSSTHERAHSRTVAPCHQIARPRETRIAQRPA